MGVKVKSLHVKQLDLLDPKLEDLDIQCEQPHPEWNNRQCGRALPEKKNEEHVAKHHGKIFIFIKSFVYHSRWKNDKL